MFFLFSADHSIIQSALDQAKMKMFIPTHDRLNQMMQETREKAARSQNLDLSVARFNSTSINESICQMSALEVSKTPNEKGTPTIKRSSVCCCFALY